MPATILYADTDQSSSEFAARMLRDAGLQVRIAASLTALENEVASGFIDVLVASRRMFGAKWLSWLEDAGRRWPDLPVILVAEESNEAESLLALRAGAASYVDRSASGDELLPAVKNGVSAVERSADAPPPASIATPVDPTSMGTKMVGDSAAIREIQGLVRRAATSNATVLIRGESGSGKEVIARRIHEMSPRSHGPFIKVHCAALPENLLESELFGHEKGAFTGAISRKPGRVEIADGGTLFLDEIGDITASTQVKLLRILQDKEYERVGGTRTNKADVRFLAATHRPLEDMIKRGEFREDLYYRLNVIPIVAPPLRARPEDIELLVRHFCSTFGAQNGRPAIQVTPEAMGILRRQPWPGNVRQLQNFVERLVVFAESDSIGLASLHAELSTAGGALQPAATPTEASFGISVFELDEVVRRAERKALDKALSKAGGNRTLAARILGVSRRTLYNKLEEHGMS